MPDGGEGTARTLARQPTAGGAGLGHRVRWERRIPSHYAVLGGSAADTAVVEMAAAAGLRWCRASVGNPCLTTTYGVGGLIAAALDSGAKRTSSVAATPGRADGGAGALQALGARVLDADGANLPPGGLNLQRGGLAGSERAAPGLAGVERGSSWRVTPPNVLCGERGVARVFARAKGCHRRRTSSCCPTRWRRGPRSSTRDGARWRHPEPGSGVPGSSGGLGAGLAPVSAPSWSRGSTSFLDSGIYSTDSRRQDRRGGPRHHRRRLDRFSDA